ncbi:hypothetical protein SeLEV6574_g08499, partial [Synchytrium endobioticum]
MDRNLATELLVLLNQINDGVGEWASKKEQWGHDAVRQAVLSYFSMSVLQELSGTSRRRLMCKVMGGGSSKGKLEQCKLAIEKAHAYAAAQSGLSIQVGSKLSERVVRLAPTQPAEESSNSEITCTANGHNSRPNQKQDPQNEQTQVLSSVERIEAKYGSQEVTSVSSEHGGFVGGSSMHPGPSTDNIRGPGDSSQYGHQTTSDSRAA